MENQFFVEAKSFHFAVVEGFTVLRVEERRRGFSCVVRLSKLCFGWLKSTLEELGRSSDTKNFIKSSVKFQWFLSLVEMVTILAGTWRLWCMRWVAGEGLS